jgi:hypothetical protein
MIIIIIIITTIYNMLIITRNKIFRLYRDSITMTTNARPGALASCIGRTSYGIGYTDAVLFTQFA